MTPATGKPLQMHALQRLIRIILLTVRYRLDRLLPLQHLPAWMRLLLRISHMLPDSHLNRGQRLRYFLEDLGPVFVKFGQVLSTRPDLIAVDISIELDHLQDDVAPFDSARFRAIVEHSLGQPIEQLFGSFDDQPLASASVAQVHAATLRDGTQVVVKALRPGIEKTIRQDITLMYILARFIQRYTPDGYRLRPVEVVAEYEHTIIDELNLQREAGNASQLRRNFLYSPMLYVPEVYWDYTRKDVMVMERIYGIPVTDLQQLAAQNTNMKMLAERGVEIFFTQVFEHNFFHADMHPGNIFVSREHPDQPRYIAVDMAIVSSLTQTDQYYMARNLLAIFRRDYRLVAELHVQSGWVPENTPIGEFEAAIRTVCEPVFEKPLKEISFGGILIDLFRTARRFDMHVQPQLVLLQKTLLNIEGLGRQLYPDLDLWQTAHPFLEHWIQERYHPRKLLDQLRRYGPELLEQAPHMPMRLTVALDNVETLAKAVPRLQDVADQLEQQAMVERQRRRGRLLGLVVGAAALFTSGAMQGLDSSSIPAVSWILALLACWLFLRN